MKWLVRIWVKFLCEREREGFELRTWGFGGVGVLLLGYRSSQGVEETLMVNGFYEVKRGCIFLSYNPRMTGLVGSGFK